MRGDVIWCVVFGQMSFGALYIGRSRLSGIFADVIWFIVSWRNYIFCYFLIINFKYVSQRVVRFPRWGALRLSPWLRGVGVHPSEGGRVDIAADRPSSRTMRADFIWCVVFGTRADVFLGRRRLGCLYLGRRQLGLCVWAGVIWALFWQMSFGSSCLGEIIFLLFFIK